MGGRIAVPVIVRLSSYHPELRAKVRDQVEAAIQGDIPFGVTSRFTWDGCVGSSRRHLPVYRLGLDSPTSRLRLSPTPSPTP